MGKQWGTIPSITIPLTADGTNLGGALVSTTAQTVLRTMGEYIISPTSTPTALDRCNIAVAIGVVSTDAFDAGAGSVPDPISEGDYPWIYWATHQFFFVDASVDPANAAVAQLRQRFDVKAMRKMKPRENLVFVVEYADGTGAPAMTVQLGTTRVLIGLH